MNLKKVKFDFDDILIQPKVFTTLKSRYNDIDPMYTYFNDLHVQNHYPIFTAPMDSVVDLKNMEEYMSENIGVVLPRTVTRQDYLNNIIYNGQFFPSLFPDFTFMSFSLKDFENYYVSFNSEYNPKYVLIDTANGHLKDIFNITKKAKEINPNLIIMIGNIANPETYQWYCENSNIDLIRIGVGNGSGCLTTQQTGTGFPKASLIHECYNIKKSFPAKNNEILPKIVADGGMKDYSDIIKALALGADYVMLGSIFNKAFESSGENYLYGKKIPPILAKHLYFYGFPVKKLYYGMSTKIAQKKLGNKILKTSEGVIRYRKIEYYLYKWVENFDHYLRSATSYSNAKNLNEFIGKADFNLISENAFNRFKK